MENGKANTSTKYYNLEEKLLTASSAEVRLISRFDLSRNALDFE